MAFLSLKKIVPAQFHQDLQLVCGIDEVGRGCWAGPLVACALIFTKKITIKGLKDSKQLSPERREEIFELLQPVCVYGIGMVSNVEIDTLGLTRATTSAYVRALEQLPFTPSYIVIDGRDRHPLPLPSTTLIKGDEKIKVIACASIIAKVTRDRMMMKISEKYPEYGFQEHKGYGTRRHQRALKKFGVTEIHRKSYKPVQKVTFMSPY